MSGAKKMPRVAPLLNVRRGAEAIEFYKSAFGAAETFRTESPDGEVVAQLNIGDCDFCSPTSRQSTRTSARKLFAGVRCGWFWLLMIHGVFNKAVAAGAKELWPVADQDYGWRVGRVIDPFGHHWEIGKPI